MTNTKYQNQFNGLRELMSQNANPPQVVIYISTCKPNVERLALDYKAMIDAHNIDLMHSAMKVGDLPAINALRISSDAAREYYDERMKESHVRECATYWVSEIMSANPVWEGLFEVSVKRDKAIITLTSNYSTSIEVHCPAIASRLDSTIEESNIYFGSTTVGSDDLEAYFNAMTFAMTLCKRLDEALVPTLRKELEATPSN